MATVMDSNPSLPSQSGEYDQPLSSYSSAVRELLDAPTNGIVTEQYTGQGEDDLPRSPVRKVVKKSSSSRINGHGRNKEGSMSQLMVQKFQDKDGEHLTTMKQYQLNGQAQNQRSDELLSGRRVGTKWEKSQYVRYAPQSHRL